MFTYVCGHMYPSVFSLNAKKKTGTMDMTPSAKRSRPKKNKMTGDDVPEKKKNKGMKI